MTTITHTYCGEGTLEWSDNRSGAEVWAVIEPLLTLIDGKVLQQPEPQMLAYVPNGVAGELNFGFVHNLDLTTKYGEFMHNLLRDGMRSVCRLKYLDVDMNEQMNWGDED